MKTIHNAPQEDAPTAAKNRSLRNLIKQLFSGWIKSQNCNYAEGIVKVLEKLGEVQELIEIMAREMHRQGEKGKS